EAKLLLDPGNRFFGTAHAFIEPSSELLDLGLGQPGRVADIVEGGQPFTTAGGEHLDPAFEGFRMEMEDGTDLRGRAPFVEQHDGGEPFGDATVRGLFVVSPEVVTL